MLALHILLLVGAADLVLAQIPNSRGLATLNQVGFMFERLGEPVLLPKGVKEDVIFNLPIEILPERFRKKVGMDLRPVLESFAGAQAGAHAGAGAGAGAQAGAQAGAGVFSTASATATAGTTFIIPNETSIAEATLLDRHEQFSLFIPKHRRMVKQLINVLMDTKDFFTASAFCRERVNRFMYLYGTSVALLHREDTANAPLPLLPRVLPEKFFDGAIFAHAREEANLVDPGERLPLEIPMDYTASDLDPEHRVAYFREDVGVNLHHWQWHLLYPHTGPENVVRKDRRGELFYYMHHQLLARYNFERFSNKLGRASRFLNWREPIEEGYFPKLDSQVASRAWPPRQAGIIIQDLSREDFELNLDVQDLERWRDRIFEAIHSGRVETPSNQIVELDEVNGIDILGNIIESSAISIHPNLYGDMHNMGHMFISLAHDPDHRHLESFGVMGDPTTAMRDPVFYRWHAFINDLFTAHKQTLTPYSAAELNFEGIRVLDATVLTNGLGLRNQFRTFWQQTDIDMSAGLDFVPSGPLLVRVTHLQHLPFRYRIQVLNVGRPRIGTVRIFMAPRFDERGTPLKFRDQQRFFIEMDKFPYMFQTGPNVVERLGSQSSVTVPYDTTFRQRNEPIDPNFYYCGCGWPQHMLVPKGSSGGFEAELFVMVSDYSRDMVNGPRVRNMCTDGHSLCGVRNQLYPDRRPMGYPFDRLPRQVELGVSTTLQMFLTPNMRVTPVQIFFSDRIERTSNATIRVV